MAVMDTTKINEPGFNKYATLLGLRFVEWEAGRCVAEIDAGPHLHHPGGIVHGGVAFGLADSAMAQVSSVEPPSITMTSCTMPSTTAGTSAASVWVSVRSAFSVGMITEIMARTL